MRATAEELVVVIYTDLTHLASRDSLWDSVQQARSPKVLQGRGFLYLCHEVQQILALSYNKALQLPASSHQGLERVT